MKEELNINYVSCSTCGQLIPDHEKTPYMMQMDIDEIECMPCEIKYFDSSDIDNFGC